MIVHDVCEWMRVCFIFAHMCNDIRLMVFSHICKYIQPNYTHAHTRAYRTITSAFETI